ncbi:MAG TPA: hypothetical protein VHO07_24225, partial [Streptosporangiaceae bacterium]|nr:hypothetical protein [Streptosporangiaceae bacterium]
PSPYPRAGPETKAAGLTAAAAGQPRQGEPSERISPLRLHTYCTGTETYAKALREPGGTERQTNNRY